MRSCGQVYHVRGSKVSRRRTYLPVIKNVRTSPDECMAFFQGRITVQIAHGDLAVQQFVNQIGPDEPGASRDQHTHFIRPFFAAPI